MIPVLSEIAARDAEAYRRSGRYRTWTCRSRLPGRPNFPPSPRRSAWAAWSAISVWPS